MRVLITIICLCFLTLSVTACSTLPMTFTTENVMKVRQGMSSDEVLGLFGNPKNIQVAVCGMPPHRWTCTTWEYGEFPYDEASFTFSGDKDALILNNFEIDRGSFVM